MNSFDLKVLLKQKKLPKKIGDLIRWVCLDGDNLKGVNFHGLTYEDISFFNVTITDANMESSHFGNSIFHNVKLNL